MTSVGRFRFIPAKCNRRQKLEAEMETMVMPDARNGSWEQMLHMASTHDKLILSTDLDNTILETTLVDHRVIGVVYNPAFEKYGNYVPSVISDRYDCIYLY